MGAPSLSTSSLGDLVPDAVVAVHVARVASAHAALPDLRVPCFGALTVSSHGRSRTHLFGPRTVITGDLSILDVHEAPLAEIFFGYAVGEGFELELDGERTLAGTVEERVLYTVEKGELVAIEDGDRTFVRTAEGWRLHTGTAPRALAPRSAEARKRSDTTRVVPLDAHQRQAAELPADRSLLILGEAGFGKTTVALHRLALLEARARDAGRPFSALVIVPTRALARLSKLMLDRLEARQVEVHTFEAWVKKEARRVFPDLPERDSRDATAAVVRTKRHPALRPTIAERAKKSRAKTAKRKDLLHLFGDRTLVEAVVARANGALPKHAIAEVLEHTHVQFSLTTEHAHRHVDRDRLDTVDGRAIDDATPLEDVESIDAEDCAVLFELQRLRGGGKTPADAIRTFDHVVVDEAQELAPIELAVIARAKKAGGSITVAGDENQQVDDSASFAGWPEVMAELGVADHARVVLKESYRCPPEVTAFARTLIAPTEPTRPPETGAALVARRYPTSVHLELELVRELRALEAADPRVTVAIIARTAETAKKLHASLARVLSIRLALGGDYDFRPGLVVTAVAEMKGLEVDVVIVPDADATTYPSTHEAKKALYVAVTRATHAVWLAAAGAWSPLVEAQSL